jgi:hypothetical protein
VLGVLFCALLSLPKEVLWTIGKLLALWNLDGATDVDAERLADTGEGIKSRTGGGFVLRIESRWILVRSGRVHVAGSGRIGDRDPLVRFMVWLALRFLS